MTRKTFLFLAGGLAVLGLLVATALHISQQPPAPVANPEALARFHSPTLGDPGAKVHIVEFFDPACETCRDFYPFVKQMMQAHPGRIRLTIRYAPFHKGSEQIVKLLEGARKQGKYWQTLEALLEAQPKWTIRHTARLDLALQAIEPVGLQMDALYQDMNSPELAQVIKQDLQDAVTLKVSQTPEFFVNGRPMPSFGYEELRALVEHALREAYR